MAKTKTVYICSECGAESAKWSGQCQNCGAWNTLTEEISAPVEVSKKIEQKAKAPAKSLKLSQIGKESEQRTDTGISELNRVLGGGIVKGSVVLVSGEPGIGKSTILLQMCANLDMDIVYVAGEESPGQIKLRASRLGVTTDRLSILSETDIGTVCSTVLAEKPGIVIVDSIQTMSRDDMQSSPGSVPQVRECTNLLMHLAKDSDIPVFIVGHVNKEGSIAGPKVMEHMVDAVLYFEGERTLDCRILRAIKNRYGSTNEVGVFEMTNEGLTEVRNPSTIFLQGKPTNVSGIATTCVLEGSRPICAEVQALVAPTPFPSPRRVATGFDYSRLNLLIAVLEKRCGMFFGTSDVYCNVIGGLKLDEPAADIAVACAVASALKDFIIPDDTALIGEIGLAGEIRAVSGIEKRISEAEKLGFKRCIVPARNKLSHIKTNAELIPVYSIKDTFNKI